MPYFSASIVFLALAMLAACATSALAAQPQQRNFGSIEGRVIDAQSFQSIPVAVVKLDDRVVTSQRDGSYRIDSVAAGTYRIRVSATGYETREIRDMMVLSETVTACLVELMPARDNTNLCDTCLRAAAFIGKVLDPSGLPIKDASIDILNTRATTRSGSDGLFSFAAIAEGEYLALVRHSQYHHDTLKSLILQNGAITNRTITLRPLISEQEQMGELAGRITDGATTQGIDKATVSLLNTERTVLTSEDGTYRLALVEPGVYSMLVTRWGYDAQVVSGVELLAGATTQGSLALVPRQAGAFSQDAQWGVLEGTVTEMQGSPLANVHIVLTPSGRAAYTDILGAFRFDTLPAGVYYGVASAQGYDTAQSDDVDVWGGENATLSITLLAVQADAGAKIQFLPGKGALRGVIVDGAKSEPVSGVSVEVESDRGGRSDRGVTDLSGNYVINGLTPGVYSLSVRQTGYANATASGLTVEEGKATQNDFILSSSDVSQMQVMSVRAPRVQNTDASLLKARKQAFTVSDGISAAEISRSGAGNVAAAMKQIPGVTIIDGKYIVIRGLSERYILTTLNGMTLPSPDPDKRAVPLDMFPTALLDNIVTYKSFTADQPGNFAGGNIDIVTRAVPEKLTFELSASTKVDNHVFSTSNNLHYDGGRLDWLGIDDGSRALPHLYDTLSGIPHYTEARRDSEKAALIDRVSQGFEGEFLPQRGQKSPNFGFGMVLANRLPLLRQNLGGVLSLTYSKSSSFYEKGINSRYKYQQSAEQGEDYDELFAAREYREDRSTSDILWGGLAALTYEPFKHQSINANYMLVHNAEDDIRYSSGSIENLEAGRIAEYYSIQYSERNLSMVQAIGRHELPLGFAFEWRSSLASTRQDQPNQRTIMFNRYLEPNEDSSWGYRTHENILPVKDPERYFRKLDESSHQNAASLVFYPLGHSEKRSFIKSGWSNYYKKRTYRVKRYFYAPASRSVDIDNGGPQEYFTDTKLGVIDSTVNNGTTSYVFGLIVYEGDITSVNYDASRRVPAYYLSGNVSPIGWLDISAGMRRETARLHMRNFKDVSVERSYRDWLPSAGVTVTPDESIKLRAMYAKTLAQPTERELAPGPGNFDPSENVAFIGNPQLIQTTIHNFDIRAEWYQKQSDLLAASLFAKRVLRPIEKVIVDNNGGIQFRNFSRSALLTGIEFEGRYSLGRINSRLEPFQLGGNVSLIRSALTIDSTEYNLRRTFDSKAKKVRALQGQSPWVLNVYGSYNSDALGLKGNINLHIKGPTIEVVSTGEAPDAFSTPHPIINLSMGKTIVKGLSAEVSITNLAGDRKRVSNFFADNEFVNIENTKVRSYGLKLGYKL